MSGDVGMLPFVWRIRPDFAKPETAYLFIHVLLFYAVGSRFGSVVGCVDPAGTILSGIR